MHVKVAAVCPHLLQMTQGPHPAPGAFPNVNLHHSQGVRGSVAMCTANCYLSFQDVIIGNQLLMHESLSCPCVHHHVPAIYAIYSPMTACLVLRISSALSISGHSQLCIIIEMPLIPSPTGSCSSWPSCTCSTSTVLVELSALSSSRHGQLSAHIWLMDSLRISLFLPPLANFSHAF